jgi:hypothetical protein
MGAGDRLRTETNSLRQNRIRAILPSIQLTLVGCWKREKNGEHARLSYNPSGEPRAGGIFFV